MPDEESEAPGEGSPGLYLETVTPQPQLPEDALEPEALAHEELAHEELAHEDDLLALRRGPSALRLIGALAALAVAAGAVTLAIWPAEVDEVSADVLPPPALPLPLPPPLPPPVAREPKAQAQAQVQAPPPTVEAEPASTAPKPPSMPAVTKPAVTKPAEPVVRAAPRFGQLTVKAIPFAYVSANGRQLGEAFGSQTYELKVGTYDVELTHPRKRFKKAVTIRAGEPTHLDFNALE